MLAASTTKHNFFKLGKGAKKATLTFIKKFMKSLPRGLTRALNRDILLFEDVVCGGGVLMYCLSLVDLEGDLR